MVSTTDRFTDKSPMSTGPPMIVKNHSARKPLRLFTEVFYFKEKTAVCRVGAAKSKLKVIREVSTLCLNIPKRKRHTKINEKVKK